MSDVQKNFYPLDLLLESTQSGKRLSLKQAADFLSQLQVTINHIGDYLAGGAFRARGHSTDAVLQRCELVIAEAKVGSLRLAFDLGEEQKTFEGRPSLGVEAIQKFYQITSEVDLEEDEVQGALSRIIDHPAHRNRIIEDFAKLWPGENAGLRATVSAFGGKAITLKPSKKLLLEGLLSEAGEGEVKSVIGILGMISVLPSQVMKIVGPGGSVLCSFSKDAEEQAIKLVKRPVIARGTAKFDAAGNVKELADVFEIEPYTTMELQRILTKTSELQLSQPLEVSIDYKDNYWIMENEDLGIIATGRDYDECLNEFHSNVHFIYTEYGLAHDSTLTPDAKMLKQKILSFVKEASEV
jgi:hypothetical protein